MDGMMKKLFLFSILAIVLLGCSQPVKTQPTQNAMTQTPLPTPASSPTVQDIVPNSEPKNQVIALEDDELTPEFSFLEVDDTVTFINLQPGAEAVFEMEDGFRTPSLFYGETFEYLIERKGTFTFTELSSGKTGTLEVS